MFMEMSVRRVGADAVEILAKPNGLGLFLHVGPEGMCGILVLDWNEAETIRAGIEREQHAEELRTRGPDEAQLGERGE